MTSLPSLVGLGLDASGSTIPTEFLGLTSLEYLRFEQVTGKVSTTNKAIAAFGLSFVGHLKSIVQCTGPN